EQFVAIRRGTVRRAGGVAAADVVETLLRFAGGKKIIVLRRENSQVRDFQIWISLHVSARQIIMPEPRRIIVPEPIVPVIASPPELRRPLDRFDLAAVRAKTKVAAKPNGPFRCWRLAEQR